MARGRCFDCLIIEYPVHTFGRLCRRVDFPKLPDWTNTRPYLTGGHLGRSDGAAVAEAGKPLSEYSTACQELLIIDDLLYAMMAGVVYSQHDHVFRSTQGSTEGKIRDFDW